MAGFAGDGSRGAGGLPPARGPHGAPLHRRNLLHQKRRPLGGRDPPIQWPRQSPLSKPAGRPTLPSQPNQIWAGHITYIPTSTGWLYLAVVIDLCSRRIVGWALANRLQASLVCDAFQQAPGSRTLSKDDHPVFHGDRGSQYGSGVFRQLLAANHFRQSMSARANPYHNDWTESFMGTLKAEMLQGGTFIDAHDARTKIFAYIEAYYNTRRKHSSPAYQTPCQFEANLPSHN